MKRAATFTRPQDPKTYKKIRFLPFDLHSSNSKLRAEMGHHFDPVTQEWLEREMSENRDKAKVGGVITHNTCKWSGLQME